MSHMYGWKPDVPDQRDFAFQVPLNIKLPLVVDLRPLMPPVYNQGDLGSCTANAAGAALQYQRRREKQVDFSPSRLFIYWNTRNIEGTVSYDSGATIRDTIKSIANFGGPPEALWHYDISKFTVQPNQQAYTAGLDDRAVEYRRIPRTMTSFKQSLATGVPIVVGISVYESFESIDADGIGDLPRRNEQLLGGHAVLIVGYNEMKQRFIIRNSWGPEWADHGYFTLPYSYFRNSKLSSDFWTINLCN